MRIALLGRSARASRACAEERDNHGEPDEPSRRAEGKPGAGGPERAGRCRSGRCRRWRRARRSCRSPTCRRTSTRRRRRTGASSTSATIDGPFTPKDQFFTTQHYGHPVIDPATFRLKVSGLVDKPAVALARRSAQARRARSSSPASSARAIAARCRACSATAAGPACRCATVLDQAGVKAQAREFVFFGADQGPGRSRVPHAEVHRSSSSTAAACRATRRCRPSRSSPTRSTASRSRATRDRRCACSCRAGTARRT